MKTYLQRQGTSYFVPRCVGSSHGWLWHVFYAALFCIIFEGRHANADEIAVFVHGLGGFGPDEFFGFPYWVYINEFATRGFTVYQAEVGPVSSNHDRACELYAQIMGTRVDYGKVHSERHGHQRYGKDYSGQGFYPEWSTENRIHILGHSMGGSTIRKIEILLQEGLQDEIDGTPALELSPLFSKQGNMLKSLTSFSATHDGSTLTDILGTDIVRVIAVVILSFAGITDDTFVESIYGFDLDQWNITKLANETVGEFFDRMESNPIWSVNNTDLAPFDLSPAGAYAQNTAGQQAYPDTYYFAFATERTDFKYRCSESNSSQCGFAAEASLLMWAGLSPFANLIGSIDQPQHLRENDGLVPIDSSNCPKLSYNDPECTEFDDVWLPGRWYYQPTELDHLQIIGWTSTDADDTTARGNFATHADRIMSVVVGSSLATTRSPTVKPTSSEETLSEESVSTVTVVVGASVGGFVGLLAALFLVLNWKRFYSGTPSTNMTSSAYETPNGHYSKDFYGHFGSQFNVASANGIVSPPQTNRNNRSNDSASSIDIDF